MFTLGTMVRNTDRQIKANSRNVATVIKKAKLGVDVALDDWEYKLIQGVSKDHSSRIPHKWTFKIYGPADDPKSKAWVHCDCPYFLFSCEVALSVKESSSVVNSNGKKPKITNPQLKPKLCKHLFSGLYMAIKTDVERKVTLTDLANIPKHGRPNISPKYGI